MFSHKLSSIIKTSGFNLHELTQDYVVKLLIHATKSGNVLALQTSQDKSLAMQWGSAVKEVSTLYRMQQLRSVGDRALYISGLFSDSFARKTVDIDYYIAMGEMAYLQAANVQESVFDASDFKVFRRLAEKFKVIVDVLGQISIELELTSKDNILRLYEKWQHTRSKALLKRLESKGVLPVNILEKGKKILH